MVNALKKLVTFNVPAFAVLFLLMVAYYSGGVLNSQQLNGKYLTVEKSALIIQAYLERQGETKEQLNAEITLPILSILKKYTEQGYVVIDTAKDENGNMTIAALPKGTADINKEVAAALKKKDKK